MVEQRISWARAWPAAKGFARIRLRSGAWYQVVDEEVSESGDAQLILLVGGERVAVPRRLLEIRDARPAHFTVVNRSDNESNPVAGTPADLGSVYAVCPECATRQALYGAPPVVRCLNCGHRGEVAWWESG